MNRHTGRHLLVTLAAWTVLIIASPQRATACTTDAECDDGMTCNGTETCSGGLCLPGTPKPNLSSCDDGNPCTFSDRCISGVCSGITQLDNAPCNDGNSCTTGEVCLAGVCVGSQLPDTSPCEDGNTCTVGDACAAGICVGGPTRDDGELCVDGDPCTGPDACLAGVCVPGPRDAFDQDGDGDCDVQEDACSCDKTDPQEVCVLPNRLLGGGGSGSGEVLMEWHTPTTKKIQVPTDDSCATAGKCELDVDGALRCTKGKIRDTCVLDSDCDQPPNTCRLIVNWADRPDLSLDYARLIARGIRQDLSQFTPATPGCSRKVDVTLDATRRTNKVRLKARGTANGRLRRERDRFKYFITP
jgi:hypothetical protein